MKRYNEFMVTVRFQIELNGVNEMPNNNFVRNHLLKLVSLVHYVVGSNKYCSKRWCNLCHGFHVHLSARTWTSSALSVGPGADASSRVRSGRSSSSLYGTSDATGCGGDSTGTATATAAFA